MPVTSNILYTNPRLRNNSSEVTKPEVPGCFTSAGESLQAVVVVEVVKCQLICEAETSVRRKARKRAEI
jgi:hypothetical protein